MASLKTIRILALLLPATAGAQAASAAARQFLDAYTMGQWAAMASLVDSASLPVVRAEAVRFMENMRKSQEVRSRMSADTGATAGLLRMMDGLQTVVGPNMLRMMFARVESEADLQALSDRELMSRWFEAKSPAYLFRIGATTMSAMFGSKISPEARALAEAEMASIKPVAWEVVGEVVEREGLAHVLYRSMGTSPGATSALTFRIAADGKWYLPFSRTDDQLTVLTGAVLRSMLPPGLPGIR
jgi:hypothetical protein